MNNRLISARCLKCAAELPVDDHLFGCPVCQARGDCSSVTLHYEGPAQIHTQARGMERYIEFLPYQSFPSLGEGQTPLISLPRMAQELGCRAIWSKNEFQNPTGSHKDRMNPMIAARAKATGRDVVCCASSGNQAASLAMYAAAAGLKCCNVASHDITGTWLAPSLASGAQVVLTKTPNERLSYLQSHIDRESWFCATNQLLPPVGSSCFGVQGYKTLAFELYEDLGNQLADYILVPTCRGDLLYGIYEGFLDLREQGLLDTLPHLVAVEPLPRLEHVLAGADHKTCFPGNSDLTPSIGGGTATYQSQLALEGSGGFAVSVSQNEVMDHVSAMAGYGLYLETSSAAVYGGLKKAMEAGKIPSGASVVLISTSHGFKNDPNFFNTPKFLNLIKREYELESDAD